MTRLGGDERQGQIPVGAPVVEADFWFAVELCSRFNQHCCQSILRIQEAIGDGLGQFDAGNPRHRPNIGRQVRHLNGIQELCRPFVVPAGDVRLPQVERINLQAVLLLQRCQCLQSTTWILVVPQLEFAMKNRQLEVGDGGAFDFFDCLIEYWITKLSGIPLAGPGAGAAS